MRETECIVDSVWRLSGRPCLIVVPTEPVIATSGDQWLTASGRRVTVVGIELLDPNPLGRTPFGVVPQSAGIAAHDRLVRSPDNEAADPGAELERHFLPILEQAAEYPRSEFPAARIHTEAGSVGSLTTLQGHMVAISCVVADDNRPREVPDLVDLVVGVQHLTTEPELADLCVCWGHPSGHIELELPVDPIPLDDQAWKVAESAVPRLVEALRNAIARGRPLADAVNPFPY